MPVPAAWANARPRLRATPELDWVLRAAFADAALASPRPAGAFALADRLDLAARIASRLSRRRFAEEPVEMDPSDAFARRRAVVAGRGIELVEAMRVVAGVAREAGLDLAWLKFAAHVAAGLEIVGSRYAHDLDVLVRADQAGSWTERLVALGFRASRDLQPEQHDVTLSHPELGSIEVHTVVLGVRLGRSSATLGELAGSGRLVAAIADFAPTRRGSTELLVAHALVHGWAQHGPSPDSYPLMRTLADLADLDFTTFDRGRIADVARLVERDLATTDVEAARELVEALVAGSSRSLSERASGWLAHSVLGATDAEYVRRSRRGPLVAVPSDRRPIPARVRAIAETLFLSPTRVAAIYGPQSGRGRTLWLQLGRPFDLLRRWIRRRS